MDISEFWAWFASISLARCWQMMYSWFSPMGMKFTASPFVRAKNQISAPLYTVTLISQPAISQFYMEILEGVLSGLILEGWADLIGDELGEIKRLKTFPEGKTEREYLFEANPDVDVSEAIGCKVEIVVSFFTGLRGKRWPVRLKNVVMAQRVSE
jgi:hypothetical protein